MRVPLRFSLFGLVIFALGALAILGQKPGPVAQFQPVGASRRLPDRLFGANIIPFYERLIDDPTKIAVLQKMKVAYTRFPGGTDANYYQPETGTLQVPSTPNPSGYKKFWMQTARNIDRGIPQGITAAQYKKFSDEIGAEVVLVPNIDTSSVAAQRVWFQGMAAAGVVSHHIEMGNEMYLAMMHDPATMAKFPDEPTTMRVIKQYYDATHEFFPAGTKVAVQAAPEGFSTSPDATDTYSTGFHAWNDALVPEDWFQAVTVHVYAEVNQLIGRGGSRDPFSIFRAVMARHDAGVDRLVQRIASRLPGKEIWVTEFNPRGGNPGNLQEGLTPAVQMHAAARACFAFLRHPQVAVVHYFMLNFQGTTNFTVFVRQGAGFSPLPVVEAMSWFENAANGGVEYRGFSSGAKVPGGGLVNESFDALEAGLFTTGNGRTLIVQNATAVPAMIDLSPYGTGLAARVEAMSPDLASSDRTSAQVVASAPARTIRLAPYSLTRVLWSK